MRERKGWRALTQNRWWPVTLLLVIQLLGGMVISPMRAFFPVYLEDQLGYATLVTSGFVAVGRVLGMIASIVGGTMCDAIGRKWTLALGVAGFILSGLTFLVSAPWLVIVLWASSDLAAGLYTLGGQSYLIDASGSERLGMLSAFYYWGLTVGGVLSNPIAGVVLDNRGFGTFGLGLVGISLATTLGTVIFLPRLRGQYGEGAASFGAGLKKLLMGYRDILRRPMVVLLVLLRFLPTCYWGMAAILIPLLINRMTGNKTPVALYATLSQVAASLAQMLAGRISDRWGRRWPTLVAFGTLIVSIVGVAGFATRWWSFYTFGVLAACAAWSLSALMPGLVSDTTRVEDQGRVLGLLHVFWNAGMVVGALVGGALVEVAVGLPFFVAAALNLAAIALAASFFRPSRHQRAVA
jgi:MFS family permease